MAENFLKGSSSGFSSPSDFYLNKEKEEFDPDALDKHDSFYYTTKSLLVLFQIMGIMPIMRSPKGDYLAAASMLDF